MLLGLREVAERQGLLSRAAQPPLQTPKTPSPRLGQGFVSAQVQSAQQDNGRLSQRLHWLSRLRKCRIGPVRGGRI